MSGLYVVALLNPSDRVAGDGNVVALDPYWARGVAQLVERLVAW
jgi:hypothetical protein